MRHYTPARQYPRSVAVTPCLSDEARRVALLLYDAALPGGAAEYPHEDVASVLARECGLSRPLVQMALTEAEEHGFIRAVDGHYHPIAPRYLLPWHPDFARREAEA